MERNQLLLILAVAALVTVIGVGSLLAQPKDDYYDYVTSAPSQINFGDPLPLTVSLAEKGGIITNCDETQGGKAMNPGAYLCDSFTYFNARSVRVLIDGKEEINFYSYPQAVGGVEIASSIPQIGAVSCYAACGACSVTSDQNANREQFHRAYFYGIDMAARASLDDQTLFTLTIPSRYLAPGNRTVEFYYFAETVNWKGDQTCPNAYTARLAGQQYGDQNEKYNHYERFTVNVIPPAGEKIAEKGIDNNLLAALIIAAGAIIGWKVILKK